MSAAPKLDTLGSFYVPTYDVRVGASAATTRVHDVLDVTFRNDILALDQFEFTVSNWDARRQGFKFEPASDPALKNLFEPEHVVELRMGYGSNVQLMIRGTITAVEPNYPQSGGPTLTIRGESNLHRGRRYTHTKNWRQMRDSDIAEELGRKPVSERDPGLGIPVLVDEAARASEQPEPEVKMESVYDLEFLRDRAERRGYVFYLEYDDDGKERLYFGPTARPGRDEYTLEWGTSLINFRPTFATAHLYSKIVVRGFDRAIGKNVEGVAIAGRDCKLNEDLKLPTLGTKVITDPPATSEGDARQRACEKLRDLRRNIVVAGGATIGLPNLRAGTNVRIQVAKDSRFNGRYFVTSTTHSLGSSGYTTEFKARREERS